jgi:hypothetical protein
VATFVKEYTAGALIGDTFRIYGRNLPTLFLICLVPMGPFELLKAIGTSQRDETLVIVATLLSLAASIFVYGANTIAVSDICLGNRPSFKRSYQAIGRVFGRYAGTYFLVILAMGFGLVLFVVPGIIATLFYLFALPVAAIERKGPRDSMKRSRVLGKGSYWRNLGVLLLASLTAGIFMVAIFMVLGVLALALDIDPEDLGFNVLFAMSGILVTPLLQIPLILLYYDMRVRKEYFDQSALSQEMFT